jgi:hypothetical protein
MRKKNITIHYFLSIQVINHKHVGFFTNFEWTVELLSHYFLQSDRKKYDNQMNVLYINKTTSH